MLITHAAGSATAPPIVSCSFVFRVVGFIIDDFFLKKKTHNTISGQSVAICPGKRL